MTDKRHKNGNNKSAHFDSDSHLPLISKSNPFKVPDNYFGELTDKIKQKVSPQESTNFWQQFPVQLKKPVYAIPLIGVTVLVMLFLFGIFHQDKTNTDLFSGVTLEQLLDENPELIENMDESSILEALYATGDETETQFLIPELYFESNSSNEELIDYLINEGASIDNLYNL